MFNPKVGEVYKYINNPNEYYIVASVGDDYVKCLRWYRGADCWERFHFHLYTVHVAVLENRFISNKMVCHGRIEDYVAGTSKHSATKYFEDIDELTELDERLYSAAEDLI